MRTENEAQGLHKLSPDELEILIAYRSCCPNHRAGLKWFASASSSNCSSHATPNLVFLVKTKP